MKLSIVEQYKTFTLKNNTYPRVYNVHLVFDRSVKVIAVDGLAIDDPKATFSVKENGSSKIVIERIDKQIRTETIIRVEYTGNEPNIDPTSYWTSYSGEKLGPVEL